MVSYDLQVRVWHTVHALNFKNLKVFRGLWRQEEYDMSKTAKIIVTIIVVFAFFMLFALVNAGREASGHSTPGILGLILLAAAYGAIRAIWKSGKDKSKDSNNNYPDSMLQK